MIETPHPGRLRRVLFVTGRLAEPALRRVLADVPPAIVCEVAALKITVAALMTTSWIARHLVREAVPAETDLVLIPGMCEGDTAVISAAIGVPVEKGPNDLREIPIVFGRADLARSYGAWDIEIVAEINNVPRMSRSAVSAAAASLQASGADWIDIGCTPGLAFPDLADVVRDLVAAGMRVSVDTFDRDEIRVAVEAGAGLVLSVNSSNIEVARDLAGTSARVVVVPDQGGELESLDPSLDALDKYGVDYLIDPVLEPVGYGFMASLERYAEVRRRYPGAEMLMGIGNVTELTAADSTGVNALLIAICQEVGVRTVLTTEVAAWAHGAVREVDVARRLMHYAVTQRALPKGVDDRLVTVKDPVVLAFTEAELRALQASLTDSNYPIFTDRTGITVLNNRRFVRATDMTRLEAIFAQLDVDEPSHAFYLGKELARAGVAVTLGKTYRQEGALSWGYLTPADDAHGDRVRLTQRPARGDDQGDPS